MRLLEAGRNSQGGDRGRQWTASGHSSILNQSILQASKFSDSSNAIRDQDFALGGCSGFLQLFNENSPKDSSLLVIPKFRRKPGHLTPTAGVWGVDWTRGLSAHNNRVKATEKQNAGHRHEGQVTKLDSLESCVCSQRNPKTVIRHLNKPMICYALQFRSSRRYQEPS
ncbi:hypothetical protein E1B28_000181 [Marasmius oreades]|uniref:Uncharacterized protein n=1 Tax=Marasmius oreades TaxID=181124 RepID=A0A9P7V0T5_9AGAR|nr:uncharacterized protein E1B28_000181 [Marasmius oreades]KAG7098213.1 hypothetical protein E1B28_000181 [Marasmius oreades]